MYYTVNPVDHAQRDYHKHQDYVQTSSKTPLGRRRARSESPKQKSSKFWGAKLELNIVPGFPAGYQR